MTREANPLYHRLIERFGELSGIPLVLNTSYNVRGEPLVETPADAMRTFLRSGLEDVVLGPYHVHRPTKVRELATATRSATASAARALESPAAGSSWEPRAASPGPGGPRES
ncbi:MAG: carbamoyltransferase C-terminal domain-containing protein [Planctomycetota bacterium]